MAARVARLVALRRAARAERKIAAVLFNFPPNAGAAGTAQFLAVFESLHATLRRLAAEGYHVEVPASVDALRDRRVPLAGAVAVTSIVYGAHRAPSSDRPRRRSGGQ